MDVMDLSRYGDLCRLCAVKTTLVLGVDLFQSDAMGGLVRKKIESCLPIQIHESDELPKIVCENCIFKLNMFMEFRDRTIRTERLLLDLYKEINHNKMNHHSISVVSIDQELLLAHHHSHEILASHGIGSVDEIDLSQLGPGHEIILTHQSMNMNGHSLDSINMDHHELTSQDLSNHSLHTEESMSVNMASAHDLESARFTGDSLDLIPHQQLLGDQFRLQHDLHVNISEASEIELSGSLNTVVHNKQIDANVQHPDNNAYHLHEEKSLDSDYHNTARTNNKHLSQLLEQGVKSECLKIEDSNSSSNSLLIDEQLNNVNESNEQVFVINDSDKTTPQPVQAISNDADWLYCNVCGKNLETESDFEAHFQAHFQKCNICLAVFPNGDVLNAHRKEAHADFEEIKPIKTRLKRATLPIKNKNNNQNIDSNSDDSGGDFADDIDQPPDDDENDNLSIAMPEKASGKRKIWSPKVCKECGKTYKTNYKLNEHMRKHTGEKPYKCDNCDKEFRSKIGLAQHAAKHTGHYDYACPICSKGFQCKSYLMVHQRVHSDVKPYPCTTCGRNFKTKQSLLDHTNRHLGVKPYMCDICGRGFITKGLCKAHQKVHTGLDNRKYSCKICLKMFVSKSYLQTHLRIHTGEKPFICEVCGKGFLTKVDLRIHTTMHTGEKSYVCEMCGKAFARRDALRCHRRSHTGERPYSCDLCGQTFTQFTPMAIHKRLHTGERPYTCESCGKTFVSRSTMMSHAKKHAR